MAVSSSSEHDVFVSWLSCGESVVSCSILFSAFWVFGVCLAVVCVDCLWFVFCSDLDFSCSDVCCSFDGAAWLCSCLFHGWFFYGINMPCFLGLFSSSACFWVSGSLAFCFCLFGLLALLLGGFLLLGCLLFTPSFFFCNFFLLFGCFLASDLPFLCCSFFFGAFLFFLCLHACVRVRVRACVCAWTRTWVLDLDSASGVLFGFCVGFCVGFGGGFRSWILPMVLLCFFLECDGEGTVLSPLPWWSSSPSWSLCLEWEDVFVCVFVLLLCCCFLDSVFDFPLWDVSEFFCCVSYGDGCFCSPLCSGACYFYWSDYSVYVCDCSHCCWLVMS